MAGPIDDPRFTPAALLAATPEGQPTGERYCEMVVTSATVASIPPYGRMMVVSFLRTMLDRAPLKHDPWFEAHRAILGSVIVDLEGYAIRDGADGIEPPSLVDLRDPGMVARERAFIASTAQWAKAQQEAATAAYDAHVDALIAEGTVDHEAAQARLDAAVALATPLDTLG